MSKLSIKRAAEAAQTERNKHIAFMSDPNEWVSLTLCCPIKRWSKDNGMETAYLIGDGPIIYHGNIFARTREDRAEKFDSFEAIYDAGWRVD